MGVQDWVMSLSIGPATDLHALEDLQQRVWGCASLEVVPSHLLQAHAHHGGCVLEARLGAELAGMVYAFPGPPESDYLYSHLAAVAPEHQGRGLGKQLKLAQADWARERGYRRIVWTFDPLQALNARLNVGSLGATCNRYLVDYYGELDDELNRGVATDRLEVDWWLTLPRKGPVVARITFPWPLAERVQARELTRPQFVAAFAEGLSVIGFEIRDGHGVYALGVVDAH